MSALSNPNPFLSLMWPGLDPTGQDARPITSGSMADLYRDPTAWPYAPNDIFQPPSLFQFTAGSPYGAADPGTAPPATIGLNSAPNQPNSDRLQAAMAQILGCGSALRGCTGTLQGNARDRCQTAYYTCMNTGLPTIFAPGIIGQKR
jgi:hypothetical protein